MAAYASPCQHYRHCPPLSGPIDLYRPNEHSTSVQRTHTISPMNTEHHINQHRTPIVFVTDTRHQFSTHNDEDVLILSRHKRAPPTAEELETKKQKKCQ